MSRGLAQRLARLEARLAPKPPPISDFVMVLRWMNANDAEQEALKAEFGWEFIVAAHVRFAASIDAHMAKNRPGNSEAVH